DGAESYVLDDEYTIPDGVDTIAAALPPDADVALARVAIDRGIPYTSVGDDPVAVRALLDLDATARARGVRVVAGCGSAPALPVHRPGHQTDKLDEVHAER